MRPPTLLHAPLRTPPQARGFTLIEVIVAVAILGILVAVAMPSYASYVMRGKRAEGRSALQLALQAQERSYAANQRYRAFSPASPNGFATLSGEDPAQSHYVLAAAACAGSVEAACVVISATPSGSAAPAAGSRFVDAECGTLTLDTNGVRTPAACWER